MRDRYATLGRMPGITVPTLIIHGCLDRTVPVGHGRALLAASGAALKEMIEIPDAGHNYLFDYGAGAMIMDWLDRVLERS